MNVGNIKPHYYRYNFKDLLLSRSKGQTPMQQGPLIAEVLVSDRAKHLYPPAPQGIGEAKHSTVKKSIGPAPANMLSTIQQIKGKDDSWLTESGFKYNAAENFFKPVLTIRRRMENEVYSCRKKGLPCPFTDKQSHCSALFIRCGDRKQFAVPESIEQKNLPHKCMYGPGKANAFIIITSQNKTMRDFCRNTIELFFHFDDNRIISAETGDKALNVLKNFKLENKQCGLLVCDEDNIEVSGTDVVTELHTRNYTTEIILLEKREQVQGQRIHFLQDNNFPGKERGLYRLKKPFHSSSLVDALKKTVFFRKLQIRD